SVMPLRHRTRAPGNRDASANGDSRECRISTRDRFPLSGPFVPYGTAVSAQAVRCGEKKLTWHLIDLNSHFPPTRLYSSSYPQRNQRASFSPFARMVAGMISRHL